MTDPRPRGSFGIDAPWVPWMWVGFALVYLVLLILGIAVWNNPLGNTLILLALILVFLACAGLYWYATLRGKFAVWREILATLPAPDRVLDMGCGRGAVAIMAARCFPRTSVDGVDLWRSIDQSGNSPEATAANTRVNGVADRVALTTGDMTELPYPDGSFDLVTASLSIHNIPTVAGRAKAVSEAWRVLAGGGRLVIVDISKVREYAASLQTLAAADLQVRPAGWRMWWSGPWMATRILTARKA